MRRYAVIPLSLVFAILLCGHSAAQSSRQGGLQGAVASPGGFSGPGPEAVSAREALTLRDESPVILRGNILRHLGKDKYMFQDASGLIRLEIEHDKWRGMNVAPEDKVEIRGSVDKDWNSVEVEVESIVMLPE